MVGYEVVGSRGGRVGGGGIKGRDGRVGVVWVSGIRVGVVGLKGVGSGRVGVVWVKGVGVIG